MTENYLPRLGKIKYTNVEPVYFNISSDKPQNNYQIIDEPPSVLNRMMKDGLIDLGPVSSFAYAANYPDWFIIPDLSVSCFNDVMSVIFASNYEIKDLNFKKVAFSKDSASAANLCRLLFKTFEVTPEIKTVKIESVDKLHMEYDGALVIGDNALCGRWKNYRYIYDLGHLWCRKKKLPFVFALWVIRKEYALKNRVKAINVINSLYESKKAGLENLDIISKAVAEKLDISREISSNYFTKLNFNLDSPQIEGLRLYYKELYKNGLIEKDAELHFFE